MLFGLVFYATKVPILSGFDTFAFVLLLFI